MMYMWEGLFMPVSLFPQYRNAHIIVANALIAQPHNPTPAAVSTTALTITYKENTQPPEFLDPYSQSQPLRAEGSRKGKAP